MAAERSRFQCDFCDVDEGQYHRSSCPQNGTSGERKIFRRDWSNSTVGPVTEAQIRKFETGATRDPEEGKFDYEGFISPLVLEALASYMDFHRTLSDGSIRASDNWQMGIPLDAYMKSGVRHTIEWWKFHRGTNTKEGIVFALCGILFNVQGYLHEFLKKNPDAVKAARDLNELRRSRLVPRHPIDEVSRR